MIPGRPGPVAAGAAVAMALTVASCTGGRDSAAATGELTVRDSAGVEIVEVSRAAETGLPTWTADPEPAYQIGGGLEDPGHVFVRFTALTPTADGGVVVAETSEGEVRRFGPDGRFLGAFGREGEGPGEFSYITAVLTGPRDSVYVWDFSTRRLTVLGPGLELGRSVPIDLESFSSAPGFLAIRGDGRIAATLEVEPNRSVQSDRVQGERVFIAVDPSGATVDTIGSGHGMVLMRAPSSPTGGFTFAVFGSYAGDQWGGDGFWHASQEYPDFQRWELDAGLRRIVRIQTDDRTVTPPEIEAYVQGSGRDLPPEEVARVRRSVEAQPVSPTFPAFQSFFAGPDGSLWVERFVRPSEGIRPHRFTVFSVDGLPQATIELPDDWTLRAVMEDHILVVTSDSLDLETLSSHRIVR